MGNIWYSQCWEDPEVLKRALKIGKNDRVISVTSGGCNTLALLATKAERVTAIDSNPAQNYLLELKCAAIRNLAHEELLEFLGARQSDFRLGTYRDVREDLSEAARMYWDKNTETISKGIIHCGKFERYLAMFRHTVVKWSGNQKKVYALLRFTDCSEQYNYYRKEWDSPFWRFMFKAYFSKALMAMLGRNSSFFRYAEVKDIGSHYLKLVEEYLKRVPSVSSAPLHYILTGNYGKALPAYLKKSIFRKIRNRLNRLRIMHGCVGDYVMLSEPSLYKFNLSDIFEYMSNSDYMRQISLIAKVCLKGSKVAYWNNLATRNWLPHEFKPLNDLTASLRKQDKMFFYKSLVVAKRV